MANFRSHDAEWIKALVIALPEHQVAAQDCGESHLNRLAAEQRSMMTKARGEVAKMPSFKVSDKEPGVAVGSADDCATLPGPT